MKVFLSYLLWPLLLGSCLWFTHLGITAGQGFLVFNLIYLSLAVTLFFLERAMPHEPTWLDNCGQIGADLAHTLFTKGLVQGIVAVGTTIGLAEILAPQGGGLWPLQWPLPAQVMLALLVAEVGLYSAHRLAHAWAYLWRFHALHHSSTRLWFFNTGRFHVVDTFASLIVSLPLLFLCGAPTEMFLWFSATTAFVGMLTHCNVEMRFGPLNYLFNTPALHRWHHSMVPAEGNKNFGENLIIFDLILGTYCNPKRRPPRVIGIEEAQPRNFLGQLVAPFQVWRWRVTAAEA